MPRSYTVPISMGVGGRTEVLLLIILKNVKIKVIRGKELRAYH